MKKVLYKLFLITLLLTSYKSVKAEETKPVYSCRSPFWKAPAETNDGLFTGDLSLECDISNSLNLGFSIANLRKRIIDKIQSESFVHLGPISNPSKTPPSLSWDVTHRFKEEGNSIQIRELIDLSIESNQQLKYETHSKGIEASGMAGYLKSVEFTMVVTQNHNQNQNQVSVSFRNRVQVKRPWFALELIFTPIARKICFKKLDQVKNKFIPWLMAEMSEGKDS